jgi:beta-phosphoglucomutase-like phosphatase (HAD superfamily)
MNRLAIAQPSGFALEPKSLTEAMEIAKMLSDSSMVPACYRGKASDTLVAMMMGKEVGLNPIQALQNIAVINGKPSIYGDAMLALVQNHPKFGGIEESFDEATMTATCTVFRRNGKPHIQKFSQLDAATAKLWGKAGPWTQYPKRMLQMRARGFALRSQFADALAGLITAEEAQDMPIEREINTAYQEQPVTVAVTTVSRTSALKDKLRGAEAVVEPDPKPADAAPVPKPEPEPEELPLAADVTYADVMAVINAADSPETMQAAKDLMMKFCAVSGTEEFRQELGAHYRWKLSQLKNPQA